MVLQRRNKDILIPDFVCVWGIRRWGVGRTGRCRWCSQCGRGTTRTGTRTQTKTTSRLSPWRRNHLSLSTMWTSWPAPAWETRCPAASMSKSKQTHNSWRTTNTHTLLMHHLLPTLVSTLSKDMVNLSLIKKVLCLILGRHLVLSAGCTFFFFSRETKNRITPLKPVSICWRQCFNCQSGALCLPTSVLQGCTLGPLAFTLYNNDSPSLCSQTL